MGYDAWCTGTEVTEPLARYVRRRFPKRKDGAVCIDPCSNDRSIVAALRAFTAAGLQLLWNGSIIYENPPYSNLIAWSKKAVRESQRTWRGEPKEIVRLVTSSPSTTWWNVAQQGKPMTVFTRRLRFIDEHGRLQDAAKFDSVLMVYAPPPRCEAFLEEFADISRGVIMPGGWRFPVSVSVPAQVAA